MAYFYTIIGIGCIDVIPRDFLDGDFKYSLHPLQFVRHPDCVVFKFGNEKNRKKIHFIRSMSVVYLQDFSINE